jgi:hypothetical protein
MNLDQILRQAASADWAHYRPRPVIDAVNALVPLGTAGALAAIETYLAGQNLEVDPQEGLFLVLRILFEVPANPGYQPPMRLGGTSPPPPPAPEMLPHFPLVLIDDVPLLMISGYVLGGDVEPVAAHVRHFRATGTVRARPLAPSGSTASTLAQFQIIYQRAYGTPPSPPEMARIEAQAKSVYSG